MRSRCTGEEAVKALRFYTPDVLTPQVVDDALSLVGHRLRQVAGTWTENELLLAYDWAMRVHLSSLDQNLPTLPDAFRKEPS